MEVYSKIKETNGFYKWQMYHNTINKSFYLEEYNKLKYYLYF